MTEFKLWFWLVGGTLLIGLPWTVLIVAAIKPPHLRTQTNRITGERRLGLLVWVGPMLLLTTVAPAVWLVWLNLLLPIFETIGSTIARLWFVGPILAALLLTAAAIWCYVRRTHQLEVTPPATPPAPVQPPVAVKPAAVMGWTLSSDVEQWDRR